MAELSLPWANQSIVDDDQWEPLNGYGGDDGVITEINPNALKVTADGSSATVTMAAGTARLTGRIYITDQPVAIANIPVSAGQNRIDRIVLAVNRGSQTIVPTRIQGTPGAGAPTIDNPPSGVTYMPIAQVRRRADVGTISSDDITDERWLLGQRLHVVNSTARPPVSHGQLIYERDTGRLRLFDGASFVNLVGEGGRTQVIPDGYRQASAGEVIHTGATGNNWQNANAVGTITVPGEPDHMYLAIGAAWVDKVDGTAGRIAIRSSHGQVRPGAETESGQTITHAPFYGTGQPFTVYLSGQKSRGTYDFRASSYASSSAYLLVLDLGRLGL